MVFVLFYQTKIMSMNNINAQGKNSEGIKGAIVMEKFLTKKGMGNLLSPYIF